MRSQDPCVCECVYLCVCTRVCLCARTCVYFRPRVHVRGEGLGVCVLVCAQAACAWRDHLHLASNHLFWRDRTWPVITFSGVIALGL